MHPPDAQRPPVAAPADALLDLGDRQTKRTVPRRHNWALCVVRSSDMARCPRCCWCDNLCGCPASAWQVAS